MSGFVCPECEETAIEAEGSFVHWDSEPLCPVIGDGGYVPATAVQTVSAA